MIPVIPSETAIRDPKDDRYNRAAFAEKLAATLLKLPPESIVIGLEGPWGGGKTTIMNFVTHYAGQQTKHSPPLIVRFNPWWYSSRDDLAVRFFEEMSAQIAAQLQSKDSRRAKDLLAMSKRFVSALKPLGKAVFGDERAEAGAEVIQTIFGAATDADSSLNALRERLEATLNELGSPVWVLMDDVDRLTPTESLEALSLVRGVGDLTNVRYFIAYDRLQLEDRLNTALGTKRAGTYLDKIVQVTIPIPPPPPNTLHAEFMERVQLAHNTFEILPDIRAFSDLASILIPGIISTPRDLKRLLSTFTMTLGLLGGDLFSPDLIMVDALRLFAPTLHDYIVKHRTFEKNNPESLLADIEPPVKRQRIAQLLHNLYPKLDSPMHPKNMPTTPLIYSRLESHMVSRRFYSEGFADAYLYRGLEAEQFNGQQSAALEKALLSSNVDEIANWIKQLPHNLTIQGFPLLRERVQAQSLEARVAAIKAILALGEEMNIATRFEQSDFWLTSCAASVFFDIGRFSIHQNERLTALEETLKEDSWTALKTVYFLRKSVSASIYPTSLWDAARRSLSRLLPAANVNPIRITAAFSCIHAIMEGEERQNWLTEILEDPSKVKALLIAQHITDVRASYGRAETLQEALDASPDVLNARDIGITLEILEPACAPLLANDDPNVRFVTERFLEALRSSEVR